MTAQQALAKARRPVRCLRYALRGACACSDAAPGGPVRPPPAPPAARREADVGVVYLVARFQCSALAAASRPRTSAACCSKSPSAPRLSHAKPEWTRATWAMGGWKLWVRGRTRTVRGAWKSACVSQRTPFAQCLESTRVGAPRTQPLPKVTSRCTGVFPCRCHVCCSALCGRACNPGCPSCVDHRVCLSCSVSMVSERLFGYFCSFARSPRGGCAGLLHFCVHHFLSTAHCCGEAFFITETLNRAQKRGTEVKLNTIPNKGGQQSQCGCP